MTGEVRGATIRVNEISPVTIIFQSAANVLAVNHSMLRQLVPLGFHLNIDTIFWSDL